jgi:hypothetical protein
MISDKVRPHHLARKALLYVRQCTSQFQTSAPDNLSRSQMARPISLGAARYHGGLGRDADRRSSPSHTSRPPKLDKLI